MNIDPWTIIDGYIVTLLHEQTKKLALIVVS
jgi:hypothetical protein